MTCMTRSQAPSTLDCSCQLAPEPGSLFALHASCVDPGSMKCLALKSHCGSSLLSTTPGVRLVGPRLISRNKFRGRPSGLGPRPTPQFWWGSELDSSPMAPPAARDGHTFTICSLGVNNAEEIAGIDADPILPGRSGQFYYDEPAFSERCALVAAIAQGDRAQIVDCRSLRDPAVDPMLHRHMGTHYVNMAANLNVPKIQGIVDDIWIGLIGLFMYAMSQGQRTALVFAFACASGRHRSVMLVALLAEFLVRQGFPVTIRHLCDRQWNHLCGGHPPCQACHFNSRSDRWKASYEYFADLMLRRAWSRKYQSRPFWDYFGMPAIPPGGLQPMLTMLPPRVPDLEEDARPPRRGQGVRPPAPPVPASSRQGPAQGGSPAPAAAASSARSSQDAPASYAAAAAEHL